MLPFPISFSGMWTTQLPYRTSFGVSLGLPGPHIKPPPPGLLCTPTEGLPLWPQYEASSYVPYRMNSPLLRSVPSLTFYPITIAPRLPNPALGLPK